MVTHWSVTAVFNKQCLEMFAEFEILAEIKLSQNATLGIILQQCKLHKNSNNFFNILKTDFLICIPV